MYGTVASLSRLPEQDQVREVRHDSDADDDDSHERHAAARLFDDIGEAVDVTVGAYPLHLGALVLGPVPGAAGAVRHRMRTSAGSSRPRPEDQRAEVERIGPDGYIDGFADVVEEAGGGMPLVGIIIIGVTVVSYFAYLILFWQPR